MRKIPKVLLALTLSLPAIARANVDFEAYYAVDIRGKPVGVSVQRNELDPRTGGRSISYLLKTTPADNDLEQFVAIKQDKAYRPLSYSFKSSVRKQLTETKGLVKGNVIALTITGGEGPPETKSIDLPPQTFFSSALGPILTKRKLSAGQAYSFSAFIEEDGKVADGEVLILDSAKVGRHVVWRTILSYQTLEHEAWFLDDGSTIATQSTTLPVKTYLVIHPTPILQDVEVPKTLLAQYFRTPPAGRQNALALGTFSIPADGLFKGPRQPDQFKDAKRIPLKIVD